MREECFLTSEDQSLIHHENVMAGVFLVLALVFPVFFHMVHLGATFLPMFFPIALCGLLISPVPAMLVGFLAPLLSSVMTGMPPLYPPIALIMAVEGVVLAGSLSVLRTQWHWPLYPSLITGILLQRLMLAAAVFGIAPLFHLPPKVFSAGMVFSGIPGVILQLIAVPPLVSMLEPRIKRMQEIY